MTSSKFDQARKAVAGVLVPGLVVLVAALQDSSPGGGGLAGVTAAEWVTALIAALGTGATVYTVRNGPSGDPTTSTPEV